LLKGRLSKSKIDQKWAILEEIILNRQWVGHDMTKGCLGLLWFSPHFLCWAVATHIVCGALQFPLHRAAIWWDMAYFSALIPCNEIMLGILEFSPTCAGLWTATLVLSIPREHSVFICFVLL
jgi:hypothetical protein